MTDCAEHGRALAASAPPLTDEQVRAAARIYASSGTLQSTAA